MKSGRSCSAAAHPEITGFDRRPFDAYGERKLLNLLNSNRLGVQKSPNPAVAPRKDGRGRCFRNLCSPTKRRPTARAVLPRRSDPSRRGRTTPLEERYASRPTTPHRTDCPERERGRSRPARPSRGPSSSPVNGSASSAPRDETGRRRARSAVDARAVSHAIRCRRQLGRVSAQSLPQVAPPCPDRSRNTLAPKRSAVLGTLIP